MVDKAIDVIEGILDREDLSPGHDDFMRLLSAKKDAAVSIINAGLKADENRFRKRSNDALQKIYEAIKKEESVIINHAP